MIADWIHIVTGQDAYKRFEKYCIVTGQDAFKGLKFINLKFKLCHMMIDWMYIVTGQDAYMMADLKFEKYRVMIRFIESMVKMHINDLGANIA
jgi:hypothetical protein